MQNKKISRCILMLLVVLSFVGCAKENVDESWDNKDNDIENYKENSSEAIQNVILEPADDEMVFILDYIPDMVIDLRYATTNNFTGQVIYSNEEAYLRYGTVKKLIQVQDELKRKGYKLVLWDGYRPTEAQYRLWEICPDSTYVANPNKGFSKHSRGNTIDISIVTLNGDDVEMPTEFDDFTKEADRDYSDVSSVAASNSQMLEDVMTSAGFKGYHGEWWHYSDTVDYPVVE